MPHFSSLFNAIAGLALGLAGTVGAAFAAPVHYNLTGSVTGYSNDFGTVEGAFGLGTSASMSLSFNETFSDGTYSFFDVCNPATGSLQVGASTYVLDGCQPYAFNTDLANTLVSVTLQFTGTGPQIGSATMSRLFVEFSTNLVVGATSLGFDVDPTINGFFSYATITWDPPGLPVPPAVPLPATAVMLGGALAGLAALRRLRRA